MLIIRRIDIRSFLRTAFPALLLANVPLMIASVVNEFGLTSIFVAPLHLMESRMQLANSLLLALATYLLPAIAGILLLVWVYNGLVRRCVGLGVVLQPAGRSFRLLRVGPKRAWGAGLLLAGIPALLSLTLVLLPTQGVLRGSQVAALLDLILGFRLLEGSEQTRHYLSFIFSYSWPQISNGLLLQMYLVQGGLLLINSTFAGGLLLWLGANLYSLLARSGGDFALRLRAARVEREVRSTGVTARLTGIYLPRTRRVAVALLAALVLLPVLLVGVLEREATPVMLLSILRWPLALLLFNRLARRFGGLQLEVGGDLPEPAAAG